MNRRSLLKSLLGAAIGSCVRWLPMPEKPEVEAIKPPMSPWATMPMTATEFAYIHDEVWQSLSDCDRAVYRAGLHDRFDFEIERRIAAHIDFMKSQGWHP